MHCTRRNVRIPPDPVRPPQPPSSSRHSGRRCVCCYPRHCSPPPHHPSLVTTVPPVKRVTRSPQRNLTHNTHTLFPRCRCAPNTHTHKHTYIYIHTYACIITQSSSPHPASRPRRRHQGSLYCVIGISRRPSPPRLTGRPTVPSTPTLSRRYNARRPMPGPRVCLARARAYTNGQCLQPGSPGHLFSAAFTHKIVNNP